MHTAVSIPQDYIFQPKTNSNRFVAFFDILGFKSIVEKYPAQEVVDKIKNLLIPSLNQSVNSVWIADKVKYISVSDSIILYTVDDSEVSCMNMFIACNKIMKEAFDIGFPLRGAISYGEFVVDDNVFVGKAYNDAVEYEKVQKWSGCVVTPSCLNIKHQYHLTPNPFDVYTTEYDCPIGKQKQKMNVMSMWVQWHEQGKPCVDDYFPEVDLNMDKSQLSDISYKIENTREFYENVKCKVSLS